jgi:2-iminobutanoate/2-iminopropanoate deaminase
MKRIIETADAPAAVGAYSQATTNGDVVFTAGQIPMTPDGDLLDDEPIDVQTRQSLENVKAILEEEGLNMQDVLKVSVFMDDIEDFDEMNETYKEYFQDNPPARSAVEVANLPKGVGVEIEAIAAQRD